MSGEEYNDKKSIIDYLADEAKAMDRQEEERKKLMSGFIHDAEIFNMPRLSDPSLFEINGVNTICRGAITTVNGKPKQGKSNLVGVLMSAALAKSQQVLDGCVKVRDRGLQILYVDTEQPIWDAVRPLERVLCTAGYKKDTDWTKLGLHTLSLRNERKMMRQLDMIDPDAYMVKRMLIQQAAEEYDASIVVVDSITDMLLDINNQEATIELRNWAEDFLETRNCAMIDVIHQNFGSSKLMGWEGTDLAKKQSDSFSMSKPSGHFRAEHEGRGKEIDPLEFLICGDHWEIYDPSKHRQEKQESMSNDMTAMFTEALGDGPMKTSELVKWMYDGHLFRPAIREHTRINSENGCKAYLDKARSMGMIHPVTEKGMENWWYLGPEGANDEAHLDF